MPPLDMRASRSERYLARRAVGSKSRSGVGLVVVELVDEGGVEEEEDGELVWSAWRAEIMLEVGASSVSSVSTISPVPWAAMVGGLKLVKSLVLLGWVLGGWFGSVWEGVGWSRVG